MHRLISVSPSSEGRRSLYLSKRSWTSLTHCNSWGSIGSAIMRLSWFRMNFMLITSEQVRILSSLDLRNNHLTNRVKAPDGKFILLHFCHRELKIFELTTVLKNFQIRQPFPSQRLPSNHLLSQWKFQKKRVWPVATIRMIVSTLAVRTVYSVE